MERKIGEVFELEGKKLKVEKAKHGSCTGCGLLNENCFDKREVTGECVDEFIIKKNYDAQMLQTDEKDRKFRSYSNLSCRIWWH